MTIQSQVATNVGDILSTLAMICKILLKNVLVERSWNSIVSSRNKKRVGKALRNDSTGLKKMTVEIVTSDPFYEIDFTFLGVHHILRIHVEMSHKSFRRHI